MSLDGKPRHPAANDASEMLTAKWAMEVRDRIWALGHERMTAIHARRLVIAKEMKSLRAELASKGMA